MAFLRITYGLDVEPEIRAAGLLLRLPAMSDYPAWAELRAASRTHLTPYEPEWSSDELTRAAYRRRMRRYMHDVREDLGYPFFILRAEDNELLGGVTISNVRRGVSQAASIGYWIGARHTGCGHMTTAVRAIVAMAFADLRLHRIEAACLPSNQASVRVLTKCGFRHEGLARRYLKINGAWRDHELFAMIEDDANGGLPAS